MSIDFTCSSVGTPPGIRASPSNRFLSDILAQSGLDKPDGRPLYRYRISDSQYQYGLSLVRKASALLDARNRPLCAIFVLVTAEWFRREADTLSRRWQDIGVVPDDVSSNERNEIARAGLGWWSLKLIVNEGPLRTRKEYLMTIARNGGLPSTLLVGERGNAVRNYFEKVMADSLALGWPSSDADYLSIAMRHAEGLPTSYREDNIFGLAAELIAGLIECRRALPADQMNNDPAGWLDAQVKGWRDRLPIHLPEDQVACSGLFNNLLTIAPKARCGGIGLRRLLARNLDGNWIEGFVVQADGPLRFDELANEQEGRFRAYFAGAAARLTSREFALVYRSETDSKGKFEVTSQTLGRSGFVGPLPFSDTVAVTLSRDGSTLLAGVLAGRPRGVIGLPRAAANGAGGQAGTHWDRLGTFHPEAPFVWVSEAARLLGHDDGAAELIWQNDDQALWRVEGMALVETGQGEHYRVQAGASSDDERRLELEALYLPARAVSPSKPQASACRLNSMGSTITISQCCSRHSASQA